MHSEEIVGRAGDLVAEHYVFPEVGERLRAVLAERARPGDLVLTLGAGSVTTVGPQLLALLEGGAS